MITMEQRKECVLTQKRCLLQTAIGKLLRNHMQDRQSFKRCSITTVSVHSCHHTLTPIMFPSPSNEIQVFLPIHNEVLPILSFAPLYLGTERMEYRFQIVTLHLSVDRINLQPRPRTPFNAHFHTVVVTASPLCN